MVPGATLPALCVELARLLLPSAKPAKQETGDRGSCNESTEPLDLTDFAEDKLRRPTARQGSSKHRSLPPLYSLCLSLSLSV